MDEIKEWHLLKIGSCRHREFMTLKGGQFCNINFPALVGLFIHKKHGAILFDTGYDDEFFNATQNLPEALYRFATPVDFTQNDNIANQLKPYRLAPKDIRAIIISHFHGDHIAGLNNFPNAQIYCAKAGLRQIQSLGRLKGVMKGLLKAILPKDIESRTHFFEDYKPIALPEKLAPFKNGIDIFGDNSLIMVELAGHCVGHWGMIANINDQEIFFIGDAAWSKDAILENIPPPSITTSLLGETKIYRETLAQLSHLAQRGNVEIIPSHCAQTAKKWVKNDK